jgi:hypothetical protein
MVYYKKYRLFKYFNQRSLMISTDLLICRHTLLYFKCIIKINKNKYADIYSEFYQRDINKIIDKNTKVSAKRDIFLSILKQLNVDEYKFDLIDRSKFYKKYASPHFTKVITIGKGKKNFELQIELTNSICKCS